MNHNYRDIAGRQAARRRKKTAPEQPAGGAKAILHISACIADGEYSEETVDRYLQISPSKSKTDIQKSLSEDEAKELDYLFEEATAIEKAIHHFLSMGIQPQIGMGITIAEREYTIEQIDLISTPGRIPTYRVTVI